MDIKTETTVYITMTQEEAEDLLAALQPGVSQRTAPKALQDLYHTINGALENE
jgi:hypothetical protein